MASIERGQLGKRIVDDAHVLEYWRRERASAIGIKHDDAVSLPFTVMTPRATLDSLDADEARAVKRARRGESISVIAYGYDIPLNVSSMLEAIEIMNRFKACGLRMTMSVPSTFSEDGIEFYDSVADAGLNDRDALSVKRFARQGKATIVIMYTDGAESMAIGLDNPIYAGPHTVAFRKAGNVRRVVCVMPPIGVYEI